MRGLKLDSREYRQICRAGKELQAFRLAVRDMAEDRGVETTPVDSFCSFN